MAHSVIPMRAPTAEPTAADILVVDDDPELRAALVERLQSMGYLTVGAGDGEEAMGVALAQHPRLILLDLQMPRMDGWQFLERRRSSDLLAGIPVVIASGERERVPAAEAAAVLEKPIDGEVLAEVVGELLAPEKVAAGHNVFGK